MSLLPRLCDPLTQERLQMDCLLPMYLGRHVLAEFWNCKRLDDPTHIEEAMVKAAEDAGATVLNVNLHHFGDGMGVTGVVMLSESHLSIHSWPEFGYAAIDVFVCGNADPHRAIETLKLALAPSNTQISEYKRGLNHVG